MAAHLVVPPALQTPEFEAAWADWLEYRRQRRLPKYTPIGLARTLARVAAWGAAGAVAAIEYSIAQNWQGIFPAPAGTAARDHAGLREFFARGPG